MDYDLIESMKQKLEVLNLFISNINNEFSNAIQQNSDWLLSLVKDQLAEGIKGDGTPQVTLTKDGFSTLYSANTVLRKIEKGQETDFITNKDTGALIDGLYVLVNGLDYELISNSPSFLLRQQNAAPDWLEPTKENQNTFEQYVVDYMLEQIQEILLK